MRKKTHLLQFYRATAKHTHGIAVEILSVRPSVRPCAKRRLFLKKGFYKVSLCENFQQQSCMAFSGLSIGAQMVGGGRPLRPEILGQSDLPPSKTATSNRYSPVL